MAKLSEEVLEEGRNHIRRLDSFGFNKWMIHNVPTYCINHDVVMSTYNKLFASGDIAKGLKMFEAIAGIDPAKELRKKFVGCGCVVFVGLGILGGVVYLFRSIF